MPEYLAPGVYVEETSFRAKSIEGVSTSTTGFVGRTRRGPVFGITDSDTPELLTSFGDFERIYGGFDDIAGGPNYLAHAVRAYFDNGGRRLFVSRVAELPQPGDEPAEPAGDQIDTGLPNGNGRAFRARSAQLVRSPDASERVAFAARFPGATGNGSLLFRQAAAPANGRTLDSAPAGSMLRLGGRHPAQPARLTAGAAPFSFTNGGTLVLNVAGSDVDISLSGTAAQVTGATQLAAPLDIAAGDRTLRATIDGIAQTVTLPASFADPNALVSTINAGLTAGKASLSTGATPNQLIITSSLQGRSGSVSITHNDSLGFAADASVNGRDDAANNVDDLGRVTADDLNSLFIEEEIPVRARVDSQTGRTIFTSSATGDAAVIRVGTGAGSQNAAVGLATGQEAHGANGTTVSYYTKRDTGWRSSTNAPLDPAVLDAALTARSGVDLLTVSLVATDADGSQILYEEMALDSAHPRWIGHVLAHMPTRRAEALQNLFEARIGKNVDPFELRDALFGADEFALLTLQAGSDGPEPTAEAYRRALQAFENIEDISIVAAPDGAAYPAIVQAINNALITHAERRRAYRIAVLDTPAGFTPTEALEFRGTIDTTRAAMYYPWVVVPNPLARPGDASIPIELTVPPSGFIAGIYARSDTQRGVFKAPANEVVLGALRFETDVNFAQQELLNPAGVNCLRFFPGRGYRVWGARTASSDPEWKYVNIRRYFNYLERSIDNGTQWVVFEPNGERLWANIRQTISNFLYNEWTSGALLGSAPKDAFFVKCDRSTMTQNDLDNGRLICQIGVAAAKPAEFVIFRIGQSTADNPQ